MDEATETAEAEKPTEAKGLRAQVESLSRENRELKVKERDGIIAGLGLDKGTGIGLVLVEQFDSGDLSLDAIAETATGKYGHVVPTAPDPVHPQAAAIQAGTERLEAIEQTAGSIVVPTKADELHQAEADGDYQKTLAIKGQQLADML